MEVVEAILRFGWTSPCSEYVFNNNISCGYPLNTPHTVIIGSSVIGGRRREAFNIDHAKMQSEELLNVYLMGTGCKGDVIKKQERLDFGWESRHLNVPITRVYIFKCVHIMS